MTAFEISLLISNAIMILAVIVGPIAAVRITRDLDEKRERRGRQLITFRTLMTTRANNLSPLHVEALNSIDLNFTGDSKAEKAVREAWGVYLNWLSEKDISPDQWGIRRKELLTILLQKMAQCLDYDFDRGHIERAVYLPSGHGRLDMDQEAIRQGFRELLDGQRVLPLYVVNLPPLATSEEEQQPIKTGNYESPSA